MNIQNDRRTVLTLDAGGTNFVFGAMRAGEEVMDPLTLPSQGHDLEKCLAMLIEGFTGVLSKLTALSKNPCAISFAFPGPADYPAGIIGDLANLPAFRGGVALGPMLEERFRIPAFINNDGDLFAYGEAIAGLLPEVNHALEAAGSPKRFRNIFGATFGTGFGGGLVHDGQLYLGDNGAAAEIWAIRNKLDRNFTTEEGVSIRAVRRAYANGAGLAFDETPEPKVIFEIARGEKPGDIAAAREAFRRMGEVAGDALASAVTLTDGLVVVGGGLTGAAPLFLPSLVGELNSQLESPNGECFPRMEVKAFNLEDPAERLGFFQAEVHQIPVPGTSRCVPYDPFKRIGVGVTRLGTSRATAIGAYAFALAQLDKS